MCSFNFLFLVSVIALIKLAQICKRNLCLTERNTKAVQVLRYCTNYQAKICNGFPALLYVGVCAETE